MVALKSFQFTLCVPLPSQSLEIITRLLYLVSSGEKYTRRQEITEAKSGHSASPDLLVVTPRPNQRSLCCVVIEKKICNAPFFVFLNGEFSNLYSLQEYRIKLNNKVTHIKEDSIELGCIGTHSKNTV